MHWLYYVNTHCSSWVATENIIDRNKYCSKLNGNEQLLDLRYFYRNVHNDQLYIRLQLVYGSVLKTNVNLYTVLYFYSDNEQPRITSGCPHFIEVFTDTLSKTVTWTKPNFTDNSGIYAWTSSFKSPFTFDLGTHSVVYVVEDPSGNTALCTVTINVTG